MALLLRSPPNVTVPIMMVLLQISTAVVSMFRYLSSTNSGDSNLVLVDIDKYTQTQLWDHIVYHLPVAEFMATQEARYLKSDSMQCTHPSSNFS